MFDKLLTFVRKQSLIDPGDRIVCAVSGGADSVALLFALYLLREKLDFSLAAVHFNHGLRGAESDQDEAFVRMLCDRYDIPLTVGRGSVTAGKKGLEAAARDARYAFFDTLPGKIATAHTADDNAETVLMHMIRGTGLKGLGAIAPQRGRIIRPMLTVTRQEVLAFLEEFNLSYRTDSSNETDDFLRNRIRHHVMPLLERENPRICENLSAMALRLRQDEQALQNLSMVPEEPRVETLRQADPAVRSRMLENFLKRQGVKEPEAEHISMAEALVFSDKPGAKAQFPGGVTLRRSYDRLTAESELQPLPQAELFCPGQVTVGRYRITCMPAEQILNNQNTFTLPHGGWVVRSRRQGDEITLHGGTKTLKKLFIDRKIPAHLRPGIPLIANADTVAAAYGIGVNIECMATQLPAMQIRIEEILE